jgi:hypothetical protein
MAKTAALATRRPDQKSPQRKRLADAIARHVVAKKRIADTEAAARRLMEQRGALRTTFNNSKAAVAIAENEAPLTASDARRAADQAEADLAAAQEASRALDRELEIERSELETAKWGVNAAVRAVLEAAPEMRALCEAFVEAKRRFSELRVAMNHIVDVPLEFKIARITIPAELHTSPTHESWQAAIAELHTDADARLPNC